MKKIYAVALLCVSMLFGAASAQQVTISSGTKGFTYHTMVDQLIAACATDGSVVNVEQTGGSPATITQITSNKVAGGVVQFDVLWMRSRSQDLTSIKTLFPLHKEQVHLVTLNKDVKSGGFLGMGGSTTVLNDVRNLKGLNVAAQGGSLYTAQAINQLSGLGYLIQSDFKDQTAALQAVREGKVHAAFIVGGAPVEIITKLGRDMRLLPFDAQTIEKLKDVYSPVTVTYDNLSTTGFQTVQTDALLVVNNYKSTKMSAVLNQLRTCVKANIDDIAETPNNHASWRTVKFDTNEKPRWDVYVGKQ